MNNDLIVIEQLPIIKARLENLSVEIKEKVDRANSLIVNDETVKEIKQVRADLNKEFNELENQRKAVKQTIMSKYDEFEEIYKTNVSNLYKDADVKLKEKIDNVENQLKQEKEEELEMFASQYIETYSLGNILSFKDIPLNITLSASMKSLKEQVKAYIEDVSKDVDLINLEEYKEKILLQYMKNGFDFANAKLDVITRHKQLEEIKKKQEEVQLQINEDAKIVEKVEEITTPKEVIEDDEIIEVQFKLKGTKEQILRIKKIIIEMGLEYE